MATLRNGLLCSAVTITTVFGIFAVCLICVWCVFDIPARSTWRSLLLWCREPTGCWFRTGPLCPVLQVRGSPAVLEACNNQTMQWLTFLTIKLLNITAMTLHFVYYKFDYFQPKALEGQITDWKSNLLKFLCLWFHHHHHHHPFHISKFLWKQFTSENICKT